MPWDRHKNVAGRIYQFFIYHCSQLSAKLQLEQHEVKYLCVHSCLRNYSLDKYILQIPLHLCNNFLYHSLVLLFVIYQYNMSVLTGIDMVLNNVQTFLILLQKQL
jgi:hypothetical protein